MITKENRNVKACQTYQSSSDFIINNTNTVWYKNYKQGWIVQKFNEINGHKYCRLKN